MSGQMISASRVVPASPEQIFAVLTDPSRHQEIDGSETLQGLVGQSETLRLGSKFRMGVKIGISYRMTNKVVEFEENRLIAWCNLSAHRWRYELVPVEGGTKVTETFDYGTARFPRFTKHMGAERAVLAIDATLDRLVDLFSTEDSGD